MSAGDSRATMTASTNMSTKLVMQDPGHEVEDVGRFLRGARDEHVVVLVLVVAGLVCAEAGEGRGDRGRLEAGGRYVDEVDRVRHGVTVAPRLRLRESRVAYRVGVQTKQSHTATGWTVGLNAVLAVCGIGLAVGNVNSPDHFMLVCGIVMALSGGVSFVLNLRTWRRSRQP